MSSETGFTITFKGDHVEALCDSEFNIEYARRLWPAITDACKEHDCYLVLGVSGQTAPLNAIDGYDHAELFDELGIRAPYRIAWVEPEPSNVEALKFVETVLYNRSLAPAKVFDNVDDARAWLFSDEPV